MARERSKSARGVGDASRRRSTAEVGDGAVVGAGEAVAELEVVPLLRAQQVLVQEGVEDELAREAEQIEGAGPILLQEGARRAKPA
jgi:hypothetical protein